MENIFSDDDDEYEAFREHLYEGTAEEENEKLVPMFGMYALIKTTNTQKPRQDLFLRGLEAPSNDLDPYKDGTFDHKKPVFEVFFSQKIDFLNRNCFQNKKYCGNFSFFGMKQDRFQMEPATSSHEDHVAERQKLLEKLHKYEENQENSVNSEGESDENEKFEEFQCKKPETPRRRPMATRNSNVDTPRPEMRKRKRIVLSSDEESEDSDEKTSPRRKRVSPIID
ncbi:hypothetical protein CRE_14920 [Caenorhabditis remanei]|uniref:Uncharacterized protein n=1 Tax=Caenorhabditis remanei TaxID=31234 RepID=E3N7R7_CAERE|nr:hypothetical protein CRE_14920 [Caenorhabditis remanei]